MFSARCTRHAAMTGRRNRDKRYRRSLGAADLSVHAPGAGLAVSRRLFTTCRQPCRVANEGPARRSIAHQKELRPVEQPSHLGGSGGCYFALLGVEPLPVLLPCVDDADMGELRDHDDLRLTLLPFQRRAQAPRRPYRFPSPHSSRCESRC